MTRVVVVSPEPTPYRAPLFDLVAARDDIALTVVYAASTVARRTWSVPLHHDAIFLRGARVPGARRLLRHDYHVTPGVVRMVRETDPDVVVVSGWSTFAAQAAIAWSRACAIPYVLLVESHDVRARPRWRRVVKEAVVPSLVRGAAAWLAIGSAARDSVARHGADRGRIRIFANTIDVAEWVRRADAARAAHEGFVVLCVARLAPEKGIDTLIRAVAAAGVGARVAVAGSGAQRDVLERLAAQLRVDVRFLGDVPHDDLPTVYADADVFALLSSHEPWGVVVNEAAAAGLPLVLSEAVGAAHDLLRDGENGFLVPPGDVAAAATALAMLASDRALRTRMGRRSRQLVHAWGYDPSVEAFVASVREAVASR